MTPRVRGVLTAMLAAALMVVPGARAGALCAATAARASR